MNDPFNQRRLGRQEILIMATKIVSKRRVTKVPERVISDETRVITDAMLGVGDNHAQGDLHFVRLALMPKSAKPRANRQLAEGTTQGSRHVCTIGDVFDADPTELVRAIRTDSGVSVGEKYIGPVVRTVAGRAYIEHPEHGDHQYEGDMLLATVFARSLDAEEREQRMLD